MLYMKKFLSLLLVLGLLGSSQVALAAEESPAPLPVWSHSILADGYSLGLFGDEISVQHSQTVTMEQVEALAQTVEDKLALLDLEPRPADGTALVLDTPKSRSSARAIPVPARLRPVLEAARCGAGCYVLTGQETPMEPRRFQRRFKSALREAGVADINFHALRHTFATNCVNLGCDAATLARILGHSDVAITLNTYVHPSFEAMRAIVDRNSESA